MRSLSKDFVKVFVCLHVYLLICGMIYANIRDTEVTTVKALSVDEKATNDFFNIDANQMDAINEFTSQNTGVLVTLNDESNLAKADEEDMYNLVNTTGIDTKKKKLKTSYELAWEKEKEFCKKSDGMSVPDGVDACNSSFKSFMAYTAVTSVSSPQYRLLRSDKAHTDEETGFRMYEDRYCVAMGSGYTSKIGTKIDIVMKSGEVIKCILGDQKSDKHTDPTHRFQKWDGSVLEMIVDRSVFRGSEIYYPKWLSGAIEKVIVLE